MRALVWDGATPHVVDHAPEPQPLPGTSVVRVRLAGICSTDLEILAGYLAFRGILGHEFVGDVISGPSHLVGRRVVGEISFSCGRCATCASGRRRHCPFRSVMGISGADGSFAEFVRLPDENLHEVPDTLADTAAVFVEPTAAAFEASVQTRDRAGGRSLVLGAGKLGLLVAQVLANRGDRVTVLCRSPRGASIARELGLTTIDRAPTDAAADLVVDATGSTQGLEMALRAVRPLGAIVLKSTVAEAHRVDLAPAVIHEITIIGSRCGPFGPAIEALAEGNVRVDPLIDRVAPLAEGIAALAAAGRPAALKTLLAPGPN